MKLKNLALVLVISLLVVGCGKSGSTGSSSSNFSGEEKPNPDVSFIDYLASSDVGHKTIKEIGPIVAGSLGLDFEIEEIYAMSKDYLTTNGINYDASNTNEVTSQEALLASSSFEDLLQTNYADKSVDAGEKDKGFFALNVLGTDGEDINSSMPLFLANPSYDDPMTYQDIFKNDNYSVAVTSTTTLGISTVDSTDSQLDVLKELTEVLGLPSKIIFKEKNKELAESVIQGKSWYSSIQPEDYHGTQEKGSTYYLIYQYEDYTFALDINEFSEMDPTYNTIMDNGTALESRKYRLIRHSNSNLEQFSYYKTEVIGEVNGIEILIKV